MKKALKVIGVIIAILVVVVVVLGLVAPKDYSLERSITINAPQSSVADYMFHFKNFPEWSPFHAMDASIQDNITGDDGTEGAVYSWKGKEAGAGEMKAKFITDKELQYDMLFKEPMENTANGYWRTEDAGNGQTKAVWGFKSQSPFPLNGIVMAIGMERMLGENFADGLSRLKTRVEALPKASAPTIDTTAIITTTDTAKLATK